MLQVHFHVAKKRNNYKGIIIRVLLQVCFSLLQLQINKLLKIKVQVMLSLCYGLYATNRIAIAANIVNARHTYKHFVFIVTFYFFSFSPVLKGWSNNDLASCAYYWREL